MYIFGYKTTVFIQNLYILVKLFGKNFIFRCKKYNFFGFFRTKCTFHLKCTNFGCSFVQNYTFYPKFVLFSEIFGKNFVFRVKSTNFLLQFCTKLQVHFGEIFWQMYHFWVQNYSFYPKFVHFSEIFWQKLHF